MPLLWKTIRSLKINKIGFIRSRCKSLLFFVLTISILKCKKAKNESKRKRKMLYQTEQEKSINPKKYKDVFEHKFKNFVKKSPTVIQYMTSNDSVTVKECNTNNQKRFEFNYFEDVKLTIKRIKDWLEDYYPIITEKRSQSVKVPREELTRLMDEGKFEELDEIIMSGGKQVDYTEYVITKMIIGTYKDGTARDELFLLHKESNSMYHYRLKMPCTIFLKQVREKLTKEEAYDLLMSKSELVKKFVAGEYNYNSKDY